MKRVLTLMALSCLPLATLVAQGDKQGRVLDEQNGRSISQGSISVWGPVRTRVQIDPQGYYRLQNLPAGKYTLTITAPGYEARQIEYIVKDGEPSALPTLKLIPLGESGDLQIDELVVMEDITQDEQSSGGFGALLGASRDPFQNASSYAFSPARFQARGYDSPYATQYLNGVAMNDLNSGYSVWSLWGGLNDMTRVQTISTSFEPLSVGLGSIGVGNNLETRASLYRRQRRLSYSNSNNTYSNRFMFTWATGQLSSGWSLALSASRRSGNGQYSYARGVHYDAWSYFLAAEKKLDKYNSISLIAFGAPVRRGVASASTQEAYDLAGSNYYNPNIGRQAGEWRNARERDNHEPIVQLQHIFAKPNKSLQISSTLSYRFGYNTYSALNWYNAPDPRPDYYRAMPSYFTRMANPNEQDPETALIYEELWRTDPNTRYINWDRMYSINRNNTDPLYSADGTLLATGARALYLVEKRHTDQREFGAASHLSWIINDAFVLEGGLNYRQNETQYFAEVGDLLGASYLYDIDKYAERDFAGDASKAQIDLNNPDHIATVGDRFGYDYKSKTTKYGSWATLRYKVSNWDGYIGASLTQTNMYRIGNQKRGLFPDNSFGESDKLHFLDLGAKLGITYRINGQHFLQANAGYIEQAPTFNNLFVSPRTRHTHINNPESEKLLSAEVSYLARLPWLRGRLTLFASRMSDRTRTMSFYDDTQAAFSNYTLSGIATQHIGAELGLEAKLSPTLTMQGALAIGSYKYDSNPSYVQTVDNSGGIIDQDIVYWKGLNTSGTPQTAATLGLNYRAPWYGFFGIKANYFGRNYISMNPVLRTDKARAAFGKDITDPEQLKDGFTVDLSAGYSWRINRNTYLRFNLSVNNILNNKNLHSGGYEQLRIRSVRDANGQQTLHAPFDSKYSYVYGTTFFFNTSLQF